MKKKGRVESKDKEHSRVKELSYENRQLQKEVARLRKMLARNHHIIVKEVPEVDEVLVKKIKKRACHECGTGVLNLQKYEKAGETWYYRACDNCEHRTRGKRYNESVEE